MRNFKVEFKTEHGKEWYEISANGYWSCGRLEDEDFLGDIREAAMIPEQAECPGERRVAGLMLAGAVIIIIVILAVVILETSAFFLNFLNL